MSARALPRILAGGRAPAVFHRALAGLATSLGALGRGATWLRELARTPELGVAPPWASLAAVLEAPVGETAPAAPEAPRPPPSTAAGGSRRRRARAAPAPPTGNAASAAALPRRAERRRLEGLAPGGGRGGGRSATVPPAASRRPQGGAWNREPSSRERRPSIPHPEPLPAGGARRPEDQPPGSPGRLEGAAAGGFLAELDRRAHRRLAGGAGSAPAGPGGALACPGGAAASSRSAAASTLDGEGVPRHCLERWSAPPASRRPEGRPPGTVPGASSAVPGASSAVPGASSAVPGASSAVPGASSAGASSAVPGASSAVPGASSATSPAPPPVRAPRTAAVDAALPSLLPRTAAELGPGPAAARVLDALAPSAPSPPSPPGLRPPGPPAAALEDEAELAAKLGRILAEDARRHGIDV